MPHNAQDWETLDKRFLWHPFTQMQEWQRQPQLVIDSGNGVWLKDINGRRYLDGVSSLWVTVHGHRYPPLDRALTAQLHKIAHSTFLGASHVPAIQLAEELLRWTPKGLRRIFYSDNGSTAVEVALKMAYQYWQLRATNGAARATPRTQFLTLENAYHGDTIGAVSVGGIELFQERFRHLLFPTRSVFSPYCYRCRYRTKAVQRTRTPREAPPAPGRPGMYRPETGCRWECLGAVERIFKKHRHRLAAAVIEPVVQAASGMIVMPPGYVAGFAALCRRYGVLLIADEVATGFGRTGRMFACDYERATPDFLCVAKSLTGGYLPLAATITTETVYRTFLGRYDEFKTFFHGHTYTANPLACAVAVENLRLYRRRRVLGQLEEKIQALREALSVLRERPHVGDIRQAGLMVGIELVKDRATCEPYPLAAQVGIRVCAACRPRGLLLRPLGNVIVLLPPFAITAPQLRWMVRIVGTAIQQVTGTK
ncbi:MAG: adenosylmethionine--8-amino-7-oxononanoate transaminase [Elusimicrobia bacterium]|nr:adenosylmethionine--8-amino-7-oxononanoate transaminase [Elusimicrobiota bacterium]